MASNGAMPKGQMHARAHQGPLWGNKAALMGEIGPTGGEAVKM